MLPVYLISIGLVLLHPAQAVSDESILLTWRRIENLFNQHSPPPEPLSSVPTPIVPLNITRGPRAGVKMGPRFDTSPEFRGMGGSKLQSKLGLLLAELESKLVATRAAQRFLERASRYGLPSVDHLRYFDNFVLSYDRRLKQPVWSLEHLTFQQMQNHKAKREYRQEFHPDPTVHDYFRVDKEDYFRSGYIRGRYSPTCDSQSGEELFDQSYLLTNVAPQEKNLSGSTSLWTRLHRYVIYLAKRSKNMFIITGTLFLPINGDLAKQPAERERVTYRLVGRSRIAVPTHFYKVFLSEDLTGLYSMEAFLIENSKRVSASERLQQFRIDVDHQLPLIEKLTGLKFFDLFDRHRFVKPKSLQYGFMEQFNWRTNTRNYTKPPPLPPPRLAKLNLRGTE